MKYSLILSSRSNYAVAHTLQVSEMYDLAFTLSIRHVLHYVRQVADCSFCPWRRGKTHQKI